MNMAFEKIKKNKKFKKNVIIGIIIFIFLTSFTSFDLGTQAAVPQSTCDQFNGLSDRMWTPQDVTGCQSVGCSSEYLADPTSFGLASTFTDWLLDVLFNLHLSPITCKSKAGTGKWVLADGDNKANGLCESGYAVKIENNFIFDDVYICATAPPGSKCKSWQEPFANILDSVWESHPFGNKCSTKAYVSIGAVGFLMLAVI